MITLLDELKECSTSWQQALSSQQALLTRIEAYLVEREKETDVFPKRGQRLAALKATPLEDIKAIILAQDPYPSVVAGEPNAMGLALSVNRGVKVPASLKNMYKELEQSLGCLPPAHGDLRAWTEQGVLLLNVLLTIDEGEPRSHRKSGWAAFTAAVLDCVAAQKQRVVFLSFGRDSHVYSPRFEQAPHVSIKTSHPSPLGARKHAKDGSFPAFLGSGCFKQTNEYLAQAGRDAIVWALGK